MAVRPNLSEETVERMDEKLGDVIRVDPEKVGMDDKINVLLDELEERQKMDDFKEQIAGKVDTINGELHSIKVNMDNHRM